MEELKNEEPPTLGQFNEHEIYPMPIFAKIAVTDVASVAAWYTKALGFKTIFATPPIDGQPSLVHLRRKKYQDILLVRAQSDGSGSTSLSLNFSSDDVDELSEQARGVPALGQSAVKGPFDTPWNTRDLIVTDPSGHQLVFTGRPANPDPEISARWKAMFEQAKKQP